MDDSIVSVEQDGNDSIQEEPRRKRTRTNLDGKSVTMTDSQVAQLSISLMNQHKAMAGIIPNTMSEETREFFRVQTQMHQEMLKRVQTEKKEDKCAEDPMELREESIEVRDVCQSILLHSACNLN